MATLLKFIMIGGAATLLQFFLLALFVEYHLLNATLASAGSYVISAIFNYLANYYLTFSSTQSHGQTLPKFIVTVCVGLALNTALFTLFLFLLEHYLLINTDLFRSAYLIAQVFATLLTLIVNFLMHKFWIYRR